MTEKKEKNRKKGKKNEWKINIIKIIATRKEKEKKQERKKKQKYRMNNWLKSADKMQDEKKNKKKLEMVLENKMRAGGKK